MRIGDFARLANVSVRTLRFYDQTHLLSASQVDASSGYRQYAPSQLARLHQIRAFQDMGFSLAEIRELLRRDLTPTELRTLMVQRKSELKRHIRDEFARLERIEQRLQNLTRSQSAPSPVLLRETKDAWVVSLRERIQSYEQAEEMFQELERKVPAQFLTAERSALWHACEASGGPIDCEVLRYLKWPVVPVRGLRAYRLPAATVASVFHCGGDDTMSESYKHLNRWLAASDFRLRGAKREIYWIEAAGKASADAVTEIQFPVMRVAARRGRAA
jgi:DNA-binding transcriptional MerR regulator